MDFAKTAQADSLAAIIARALVLSNRLLNITTSFAIAQSKTAWQQAQLRQMIILSARKSLVPGGNVLVIPRGIGDSDWSGWGQSTPHAGGHGNTAR